MPEQISVGKARTPLVTAILQKWRQWDKCKSVEVCVTSRNLLLVVLQDDWSIILQSLRCLVAVDGNQWLAGGGLLVVAGSCAQE